jgi:hypothetical protein
MHDDIRLHKRIQLMNKEIKTDFYFPKIYLCRSFIQCNLWHSGISQSKQLLMNEQSMKTTLNEIDFLRLMSKEAKISDLHKIGGVLHTFSRSRHGTTKCKKTAFMLLADKANKTSREPVFMRNCDLEFPLFQRIKCLGKRVVKVKHDRHTTIS